MGRDRGVLFRSGAFGDRVGSDDRLRIFLRSAGEIGAPCCGGASVEDADDRGTDAKIKTDKLDVNDTVAELLRGDLLRPRTCL